ncbi:MAG: hypothetical protein AAFX79_13445 [Planctomycetota bacterium]
MAVLRTPGAIDQRFHNLHPLRHQGGRQSSFNERSVVLLDISHAEIFKTHSAHCSGAVPGIQEDQEVPELLAAVAE